MPVKRKKSKKKERISAGHRIWRISYRICIVLFVGSLLWVTALKYIPVRFTPLMVRRTAEAIADGRMPKNQKQWVPLEHINCNVPLACIASEDNLFLTHNGFSIKAMEAAVNGHKKGRPLRGASTISQQTAKNVFTFCTRTWLRKGIEAYYTCLIELIWGKERIMEVYLNIVELGDGIYGVEAASQHYFGKPASHVNAVQASLIAAALPSPRSYSISRPGPYMLKRSSQILLLMPKMRKIPFGCQK